MTRVQVTAVIAVIVAVAATWLAHVGDTLTSQIALKNKAAPNAPQVTRSQVTRTRIITSVLDPDPTVVGSIPRPPVTTPEYELRR